MNGGDDETTIGELKRQVAAFNAARDWGQFHSAKDLAMAVSVEANELLELFLWRDAEAPVDQARLREEIGDVCITLMNLANVTGIDAPYEAPDAADLRLDTQRDTLEQNVQKVIEHLQQRGLLDKTH